MQKRVTNNTESKDFVREYFKKWPKFYFFVANVIGPIMPTGLGGNGFLDRYPKEGKTLNLGSGPRVLKDTKVINVDLTAYASVDIVADVMNVPLPDASVARIVSDNVLEHVKDPVKAVQEMYRLLEPGGLAYIATPFMYPFHSSPSDYQRWTIQGLRELFNEFEIVEQGVRGGPFSALNTYMCHVTGVLFSFGVPFLYSFFVNASMFVFWPIKLLDIVFAYVPNAVDISAVLYIVVKKR